MTKPNNFDLWENMKYFSPYEFDSPDAPASGYKMDIVLIYFLVEIRRLINIPILISSGYRTLAHNENVKGEVNSSHLKGLAVDILCKDNRERYLLLFYALMLKIKRIGIYKKHIHLDIDPDKPQNIVWYGSPPIE